MKAAFQIPIIAPITGRPTLVELLMVLKHVCRISQSTKSQLGPFGYLFVALPLTHYQWFTNIPLNLPPPTPELPDFSEAIDQEDREYTRLIWQTVKAENNNIANIHEALTTVFLATIPDSYKQHLENDLVGRTNANFWGIFDTLFQKYGQVKPMDIEDNLTRMNKEWDPTTPIENIFSQINDTNDANLVNAG